MHPVLFEIPTPWGDVPVRMFGLFIIDAFFVATLWAQWQYSRVKIPAFAEDAALNKAFRIFLIGLVVNRLVWIAAPVPWKWAVLLVLCWDYLSTGVLWWTAWRRALKANGREEADFIFNFAFWLLIVGFVGSRLFWIVTTPSGREAFVDNPGRALIAVWDGGIVWYGGLLFAVAFGVWYLWLKNRNILQHGDIALVAVSLALVIGRWACFSAGDDYGRSTDVAWAVVFPDEPQSQIPAHLLGVPIHATQLYMSLNGLILFLAGVLVLSKKKFHGQALYLSLMLYAVGRSIIEIYRGDVGRGLYDVGGMELSSSQLISLPIFVVAGWLFLKGWLRARRRAESATPAGEDAG